MCRKRHNGCLALARRSWGNQGEKNLLNVSHLGSQLREAALTMCLHSHCVARPSKNACVCSPLCARVEEITKGDSSIVLAGLFVLATMEGSNLLEKQSIANFQVFMGWDDCYSAGIGKNGLWGHEADKWSTEPNWDLLFLSLAQRKAQWTRGGFGSC